MNRLTAYVGFGFFLLLVPLPVADWAPGWNLRGANGAELTDPRAADAAVAEPSDESFLLAGARDATSAEPFVSAPDASSGGFSPSYVDSSSFAGGRLWVDAEYLQWWTKGSYLPPLVTTSPVGAPPGVLGQPTTTVLFGGHDVNGQGRSGFRLNFGYWFGPCCNWAVVGDYFDLGQIDTQFDARCDGTNVLARPFHDVTTGLESSEIVCYPTIVTGRIHVDAASYFQGAGLGLRHPLLCRSCCEEVCCEPSCGEPSGCGDCRPIQRSFQLDLVGGYRNYRNFDSLSIQEHLVSINPGGQIAQGTTWDIEDRFTVQNEFHGGEVGLAAQFTRNCWSLGLLAKLAMGNNHQVATVDGSTVVNVPGDPNSPARSVGGLLALSSNIGQHTRDQFVVIPQFGLDVGYQLTCRLRVYAGYDFLYWGNVARAGDLIDLGVNPGLLPGRLPPPQPGGPARPACAFHDSDFWAQGLKLGLQYQF